MNFRERCIIRLKREGRRLRRSEVKIRTQIHEILKMRVYAFVTTVDLMWSGSRKVNPWKPTKQ